MIRINKFFVDNLWRWKCGLPEIDKQDKISAGSVDDISDLARSQIPKEFHEILELADNRMIQGAFRYGHLEVSRSKYDVMKELHKRIKIYQETENLEYLADALNMIRIEYLQAKLENKSVVSIDDGHHATLK